MVDLIAKTPAEGLLPVRHGEFVLRELDPMRITSVAPFENQEKSVTAALKKAIGAGLPGIGRLSAGKSGEVLWSSRGEYFVLGGEVPTLKAAITDQSDAWTCVALEGPGASAVLARLCPLNFGEMGEGDVARSLIGHMSAVIICRADGYDLMVFRAFAKTLVHEVETAMRSVVAQAGLNV